MLTIVVFTGNCMHKMELVDFIFFNYKLVSSGVGKDCALLVFRILVALVVWTRCYYFVSSGAGTK